MPKIEGELVFPGIFNPGCCFLLVSGCILDFYIPKNESGPAGSEYWQELKAMLYDKSSENKVTFQGCSRGLQEAKEK